jgi:hypothetical protein
VIVETHPTRSNCAGLHSGPVEPLIDHIKQDLKLECGLTSLGGNAEGSSSPVERTRALSVSGIVLSHHPFIRKSRASLPHIALFLFETWA